MQMELEKGRETFTLITFCIMLVYTPNLIPKLCTHFNKHFFGFQSLDTLSSKEHRIAWQPPYSYGGTWWSVFPLKGFRTEKNLARENFEAH